MDENQKEIDELQEAFRKISEKAYGLKGAIEALEQEVIIVEKERAVIENALRRLKPDAIHPLYGIPNKLYFYFIDNRSKKSEYLLMPRMEEIKRLAKPGYLRMWLEAYRDAWASCYGSMQGAENTPLAKRILDYIEVKPGFWEASSPASSFTERGKLQ